MIERTQESGATRLLSDGRLRALLFAEVVSTTGAELGALAVPWLVLTTTGSAAKMGLVMAAEMAPVAVFGVLGGSLVARVGVRRFMLISDLARAALVALIAVLSFLGTLSFPLLLAVVFMLGAFYAPYLSCQQLILPLLLGEDETVLSSASALLQGATRTTILLGAPLAGVLIAAFGPRPVLLLDAASFLASFCVIVLFVRPLRPVARDGTDAGGLLAGLRFLTRDRLMGCWGIGSAVTEAGWQALMVVIPVLAYGLYGGDPRVAGWLLASFGAGALGGNLLAVPLLRLVQPVPLATVGKLGQAAGSWALLALFPSAVGLGFGLAVVGILNGLTNAPANAVRLARTPAALREKVITASMTLILLGGALGLAAAGPSLEIYGEAALFVAIALLQTLGGLFYAFGAGGAGPRKSTH